MELYLLTGVATALLAVIISLYFFVSRRNNKSEPKGHVRHGVPVRAQEGVPRRAQIVRNQRNRARGIAAAAEDHESDEEDEIRPTADINGEKMGAKKRAKLEAKAEKKAQREIDLKMREDQKRQDAIAEEERQKFVEKEKEEELQQEAEERQAREEQEQKEHEEYLRMKEAFSVEEEGFEEGEDDDQHNLLQEFVEFIQNNKVVVLEDVAAHFKLKTQAAIDRIIDLQKEGRISGVIDDRGKFIYISEDELKAVAKFIKQRGRVSITELAESSNNLINLTPVVAAGGN